MKIIPDRATSFPKEALEELLKSNKLSKFEKFLVQLEINRSK